jgi:hypothetical protein
VVHGIAARRIPPKEGELSSDAFHAGGLSPKELDEWFRRGLLPSIIFVLTGVVRDEKYAVKSIHEGWNPHSAARVFYVTFISGKHLGYAFTTDLKDKMTANVFGEGGLKGWVDPEYKEFKGIFSPFVFKDATFTQGFPEQLNQFPVRDGEEHTLLTPFYRDSTPQRVAENIDQKVRPLFETLGRDETLLEIARHFHQYKLKEERLENERDFDSSFAKLDPERKDDYKTRSTDTSQITNALQYYVFKYIQETISQALGRIRAVTCLHDSDFSALMDLVRRENPPAAE